MILNIFQITFTTAIKLLAFMLGDRLPSDSALSDYRISVKSLSLFTHRMKGLYNL